MSFGFPHDVQQQIYQDVQVDDEEEKIIISQKRKNLLRLSYEYKVPLLENQIDIVGRRNSLPEQENESRKIRKIISNKVIQDVKEMGLDVNLAIIILNTMLDEEFIEENLNKISMNIIDYLLQTDVMVPVLEKHQSFSLKEISLQFKNLFGLSNNSFQDDQSVYDQFDKPECPICYIVITQQNLQTLHCGHFFCSSCVHEYLKSKIMQSEVNNITCPNDDCNFKLKDDEIKQLVGSSFYDKMLKFRKLKILSENENIRFCSKPGCEFHVVRQNNEKILTCECGEQICFKCGNTAHQGRSCEDALDQTFKQAVKEYEIQKCPKCKSPIQKSSGCNHMTCQHCNYEFCWLCRAKYGRQHFENFNIFGCPAKQYSNDKPYKHPCLRKFAIVSTFLIFILPALALALAGAVLFLPILLMEFFYGSYSKFLDNDRCYKVIMSPIYVILSILISPISLILLIIAVGIVPVIGLFYPIWLIFKWCCRS